jgi:hypothetical protein
MRMIERVEKRCGLGRLAVRGASSADARVTYPARGRYAVLTKRPAVSRHDVAACVRRRCCQRRFSARSGVGVLGAATSRPPHEAPRRDEARRERCPLVDAARWCGARKARQSRRSHNVAREPLTARCVCIGCAFSAKVISPPAASWCDRTDSASSRLRRP